MRSNKEFADICRDYTQIVDDIARKERTPGHSSAVLAELLRLKSDLERDIVDHLSEAEVESHVSDVALVLHTKPKPRGVI